MFSARLFSIHKAFKVNLQPGRDASECASNSCPFLKVQKLKRIDTVKTFRSWRESKPNKLPVLAV